jgi:FAD synthase
MINGDAQKVVRGVVLKGAMMGRKINFPTINVAYDCLDLPYGVYVSRVHTPLGAYKGAMHYGPRSLQGAEEPSLEVHLLDFSGDLYGSDVTVEIYGKVREVRNFESRESLKKQIRLDVEYVREAVLK